MFLGTVVFALFCTVLFATGFDLVLIGLRYFLEPWNRNCQRRTTAVITELEKVPVKTNATSKGKSGDDEASDFVCRAKFKYTLGWHCYEQLTAEKHTSSYLRKRKIGQAYQIHYNEDAPGEIRDNTKELIVWALAVLLGAVIAVRGIIMFVEIFI